MYYKRIGTTRDIAVFGSNINDMSCHYCCSTLKGEPLRESLVWARVSNSSALFLHLLDGIVIHEITQEEYKAHLRFCAKILTEAIEGRFTPMKLITASGEFFDYKSYEV